MRLRGPLVACALLALACGDAGGPAVAPAPAPTFDGCGPEEVAAPGAPLGLADALDGAPPVDPAFADTVTELGGRSYAVPQVRTGLAELFDGAAPTMGDLHAALLACRVQADGGKARKSRRDLPVDISVRLGSLPEVLHRGQSQDDVHLFSIPGVDLRSGDALAAKALSRNANCDWGWMLIGVPACWDKSSPVGSADGTWDGRGPIRFARGDLPIECRPIAPAAAITGFDRRLSDLDSDIGVFCSALRVDPGSGDFGWDDARYQGLVTSLEKPAGYVGWGDPRVRSRTGRLDRIRTSFEQSVVSWLSTHPGLPIGTDGEVSGFHQERSRVLVTSPLACGPVPEKKYASSLELGEGESGCALEIELANLGAEAQSLDAFGTSLGAVRDVDLVLADGSRRWVRIASFAGTSSTSSVPLAPGASIRTVLVTALPTSLTAGGDRLLLRVIGGKGEPLLFTVR